MEKINREIINIKLQKDVLSGFPYAPLQVSPIQMILPWRKRKKKRKLQQTKQIMQY